MKVISLRPVRPQKDELKSKGEGLAAPSDEPLKRIASGRWKAC